PPLARLGGPAGYLYELARAATADSRGHEVLFPPVAPRAAAPARSPVQEARTRLLQSAGRFKRRLFGVPRFYRPPLAELEQEGGRLAAKLEANADHVWLEAASSREAAQAGADVLFAHDVFVAERLLAERRPDQEVWLLAHAPFPMALYLAWSWAIPELPWETIAAFPDVRAGISRELRVWEGVDRLIVPCREAGDELVRVDPRFAAPLRRADLLLSGAAGPEMARATARRSPSRRAFRLPERQPVGLFLGNAQPYRGLDALVAALPFLPSGRALPGVVAVAGPPAETVAHHPRLRALGRVSAVPELLRAIDFVINVNRFSLFDLSTIEATEAGAPLLLHATGGNNTFRDLGAGCQMIGDLAPATVAAGLAEMFVLPTEGRSALAAASRTCYETHLTPAHLWRRHLDLYDVAAAGSTSQRSPKHRS
ncbi:MAG TPA: hypothetical protein VGE98_06135, partial [Thermoanaerobaculia bacterium]